ncbi:nucleotide-diphospho-sugar transferase [Podospora australis]|uniref:Nucleotide-diphospho-sugar transferase n=1 Tax=Podospora australis TaxID=1536484 RepID=A0AAN6X2R1_9PEZI|nr:nucleotide-diphospho-sugar transferase [Podospora australis]
MVFPRKAAVIAVWAGLTIFLCYNFFLHSSRGIIDSARLQFEASKTLSKLLPPKTQTLRPGEERFAYVQYATNEIYLCNALINFARLKECSTKHDLALIYPEKWDDEKVRKETRLYKLMRIIRAKYPGIKLYPSEVLWTPKGDSTWADSLTKLHAFALTEYSRVLVFDSDTLVLNNMDRYFLAPRAAVAVPRAYWMNEHGRNASFHDQVLGSHVMLVEPNTHQYQRVVEEARVSGDFDMEVVNHLFKDSAMILPHRGLALLTGEFRSKDHSKYLAGDEDDVWDAVAEAASASLVHFSDWPLPKPWIRHSDEQWNDALPTCPDDGDKRRNKSKRDCPDRTVWASFYEDHASYMAQVCVPIWPE